MTFHEKSLWASLLVSIGVYGTYFWRLAIDPRAASRGESIGQFLGAVVLLVILEIGTQTIIALRWKEDPKDEREHLIDAKSYRNAYLWMFFGSSTTMLCIFANGVLPPSPPLPFVFTPFTTLNILIFVVVVAEMIKVGTQLFYYRRGV